MLPAVFSLLALGSGNDILARIQDVLEELERYPEPDHMREARGKYVEVTLHQVHDQGHWNGKPPTKKVWVEDSCADVCRQKKYTYENAKGFREETRYAGGKIFGTYPMCMGDCEKDCGGVKEGNPRKDSSDQCFPSYYTSHTDHTMGEGGKEIGICKKGKVCCCKKQDRSWELEESSEEDGQIVMSEDMIGGGRRPSSGQRPSQSSGDRRPSQSSGDRRPSQQVKRQGTQSGGLKRKPGAGSYNPDGSLAKRPSVMPRADKADNTRDDQATFLSRK